MRIIREADGGLHAHKTALMPCLIDIRHFGPCTPNVGRWTEPNNHGGRGESPGQLAGGEDLIDALHSIKKLSKGSSIVADEGGWQGGFKFHPTLELKHDDYWSDRGFWIHIEGWDASEFDDDEEDN
jgi:hypothetical protein